MLTQWLLNSLHPMGLIQGTSGSSNQLVVISVHSGNWKHGIATTISWIHVPRNLFHVHTPVSVFSGVLQEMKQMKYGLKDSASNRRWRGTNQRMLSIRGAFVITSCSFCVRSRQTEIRSVVARRTWRTSHLQKSLLVLYSLYWVQGLLALPTLWIGTCSLLVFVFSDGSNISFRMKSHSY